MKITLEHEEIVQAIEEYLEKQVNLAPGQKIEMELTAGRQGRGHYADIQISSTETSGSVSTSKTSGRVAESDSDTKDADESTEPAADGDGDADTKDPVDDSKADSGGGAASSSGSLFSD